MLALITAIFSALAATPKIFSYIEKLVGVISDALAEAKRKKAEDDARKAADKAKNTKDTTDFRQPL